LDGEASRQLHQQQLIKEKEAEKDSLINQFARDFGFLASDIRRFLAHRGLEPVRGPMTPRGRPTTTTQGMMTNDPRFHSISSGPSSIAAASDAGSENDLPSMLAVVRRDLYRSIAFSTEEVASMASGVGISRSSSSGHQVVGGDVDESVSGTDFFSPQQQPQLTGGVPPPKPPEQMHFKQRLTGAPTPAPLGLGDPHALVDVAHSVPAQFHI
jgi:hypothetical protein